MADNVFDVIRGDTPALVETLNSNDNFCTFMMAVYAQILAMVSDSPYSPKELEISVSIVRERLLLLRSAWKSSSTGANRIVHNKMPGTRNMTLVQLLQVNTSVRTLTRRTVEALEIWIKEKDYRKEVGFKGILFENGRLVKGEDVFTCELVLKPEYDYDTIKQMGWDKDEQPTEEERRIIVP